MPVIAAYKCRKGHTFTRIFTLEKDYKERVKCSKEGCNCFGKKYWSKRYYGQMTPPKPEDVPKPE